ncbi:TPA: hypothetical protein MNB63_005698 [Klebsiella pneumoniae]|nr:hypothetical protein [Klebsiella pneumoniae]HBR6817328.1 hypothetical protein [Klebsiella pneumoniae]HBV4372312.1 hypothetical protein [Klebsiella pneumoniae]HBW5193849.1 hypothetical protein [Klebsiella pneumoniae]HBW5602009.1 hypothetical protein [Klebsiella pneumoniae]
MNEKVDVQEAFDALTNRVCALESELFAVRARDEVLHGFLTCQLMAHPSPEKVEKVWKHIVNEGIEKKILARYEKSEAFKREDIVEAFKKSLHGAVEQWIEEVECAREIQEK